MSRSMPAHTGYNLCDGTVDRGVDDSQYACTYWLQLHRFNALSYAHRLAVCLHILVATAKINKHICKNVQIILNTWIEYVLF